MRVAIVTVANTVFGFGHYSRCKTIVQEFFSRNAKPFLFLIDSVARHIDKDLSGTTWKRGLPVPEDFDLVLFDLPEQLYRNLPWESYGKRFTVAINMFDYADPRYEDLAFLPMDDEKQETMQMRGDCTRQYSGFQYVVINPQFFQIRKRAKKISQKANKILISMGGADPEYLTELAVKAIQTIGLENNCTAIIPDDERRHDLSEIYPNIEYLGYQDNLPDVMYEYDIVIMNGGLTRYETSCLGILSIAISIHQIQYAITERWNTRHCCINAGIGAELSLEKLGGLIWDAVEDESLRRQVFENRFTAVPENGSKKIVDIIYQEMK